MELVSLRDKTEHVRHVTRLSNLGNHSHNQKVLKEGSGQFLVTYRPKRDTKVRDYVPCENCWAYVLKAELFRHKVDASFRRKPEFDDAMQQRPNYYCLLQREHQRKSSSC